MHDASPERRNLMATSFAFIVYYWGKCEFTGDKIRLLFAEAHFNNPTILAVLAWVVLLFFALRFWQSRGVEQKNNNIRSANAIDIVSYQYSRKAKEWINKLKKYQSKSEAAKEISKDIILSHEFFSYVFPYIIFFVAVLSGLLTGFGVGITSVIFGSITLSLVVTFFAAKYLVKTL